MDNLKRWIILWAASPIKTRNQCLGLLEAYNELHKGEKQPLELNLLTPYDFLSEHERSNVSKSSGFQFNYLFTDLQLSLLDDFVYFCRQNSCPIQILNRHRINGETLSVASVSEEEIRQFLTFCDAYMLYHKNLGIAFLSVDDMKMHTGDAVYIKFRGIYSGQTAIVSDDQTGVEEGFVRVLFQWFGYIEVADIVPKSDIERMEKARFKGSPYSLYFDFFTFFLSPQNLPRMTAREFSSVDQAKALRLKSMAQSPEKVTRKTKESKFAQLVRLTALHAACYILREEAPVASYAEWDMLYQLCREKKDVKALGQVHRVVEEGSPICQHIRNVESSNRK